MFIGAIPKPCIEQALGIVPVGDSEVFVCCSGSFRLEQGIAARYPKATVHSNDVSLLSTAYGQLATGNPLAYKFTGRLEPLERVVEELGGDPITRLAALTVAVRMGSFAARNEHSRLHFQHYLDRAEEYVVPARAKVQTYLSNIRIASYSACDFREHAIRGVERGAIIFAWPPTYKGGYERIYRLLNANVEWQQPTYDVFDPKTLAGWLDDLDALGARYCVCADHPIEGRKPSAWYRPAVSRPVFLFASKAASSSVRRDATKRTPFKYEPLDPWILTKDSKIQLVRAESGHMNFLKDVYLAHGIFHVSGKINFLVYIDGKLAGGFIFRRDNMAPLDSVYLLCDFAVSRERRLSKLIVTLALSDEVIRTVERKEVSRFKQLATTCFTHKPVSMKYRGVWNLDKRGQGFLIYTAAPSRRPAQELYAEWFKRAPKDKNRPSQAA